MKSKLKSFLVFLIIYFSTDFVLSNLFLYNYFFKDLEKIYYSDIKNRIYNKDYKYTFKSNASFYSKYNDFIYKIDTNDFGFRAKSITDNEFSKDIYFFSGDSFLESVGLNYNDSLIAKLENTKEKQIDFLNSGVASYSTFIYKKKIISFIKKNKNLKIKKVIILLDKSDPIDDQQYVNQKSEFRNDKIKKKYKKNFNDYFITFSFLKIFGNFLDEKRRNFKYRYRLSKKYNKNIFSFTKNQVEAFKSIGNRKFISNYYRDKNKWIETLNYFDYSIDQLLEIESFLEKYNIDLEVFIYPWPFELIDEDARIRYLNFLEKNEKLDKLKINSCYDYFLKNNELEQLEFIGKSYLFADIHYNSYGNDILAKCIKDKLAI